MTLAAGPRLEEAEVASVQEQSTVLLFDPDRQRCLGTTKIVVRNPSAVLGLHCAANVTSVEVGGAPVAFTLLPRLEIARPAPSGTVQAVAKDAERAYWELRRAEMERLDLLIAVGAGGSGPGAGRWAGRGADAEDDSGDDDGSEEGSDYEDAGARARREAADGAGQAGPLLEVVVRYEVGPGGVLWSQRCGCTALGVHRTRTWLPCVDSPGAMAPHTLAAVVPDGYLAVGPGRPLERRAEEIPGIGRAWRVAFAPTMAVPAETLAVVVGPWQARPVALRDLPPNLRRHEAFQTWPRVLGLAQAHVLARPERHAGTAHAAHTLGALIHHVETHLACPLPVDALSAVFVPRGCLCGTASQGRLLYGLAVLPEDWATGTQVVEDFVECAAALALAVSQQWFGVFMHAYSKSPAAAAHHPTRWAAVGCARYLRTVLLARIVGDNEAEARALEQRRAAVEADVLGTVPPLHSPFGPFAHLRPVVGGKDAGKDGAGEKGKEAGAAGTSGAGQGADKGAGAGEPGATPGAGAGPSDARTGALAGGDVAGPSAAGTGAGAGAGASGRARVLTPWERDWGSDLRGLECLGEGVLDYKAEAVVTMLARRVGKEEARKAFQSKLRHAAASKGGKGRRLDTKKLLRMLVGQMGEKRLDRALAKRWVHGRGAPVVRWGLRYLSKDHVFVLALEQRGTPIAQISSQAASQEGGGIGTLRIVLHETDGPNERSVPLGDSPAVCEFIECRSRRPGMRKRQRKPRDGEDGPAPEPPLPLRWVALDPDLQWLADFRLEGIGTLDDTLRCLDEQLHHSRLAAAQWRAAETLVALAREEPCPRTRAAVLQSLSRAAASPDLFYRVRLCALRRLPEAEALARASGHEGRALTDVLDLLHRACPGGALRKVFADFSEYFVLKAAPGALACFRDGRGESPDEAIEAVLHILAEGDAVGVPHDASRLRAAFVEALGLARPVGPMLGRVVRELHRQIQVDWVMPSPEHALTQAALRALTSLALSLRSPLVGPDAVERLLQPYLGAAWGEGVRLAAAECLADLGVARGGVDEGLRQLLSLVQSDSCVGFQLGALDCAMALVHDAWGCAVPGSGLPPRPARSARIAEAQAQAESRPDTAPGVTPETAAMAYAVMAGSQDPAVRHAAFCLVQSMAGKPPTLYRPDVAREQQALGWSPALAAGGQRKLAISRIRLQGAFNLSSLGKVGVGVATAGAGGAEAGPSGVRGTTTAPDAAQAAAPARSVSAPKVGARPASGAPAAGQGNTAAAAPRRSMTPPPRSGTPPTAGPRSGTPPLAKQRVGTPPPAGPRVAASGPAAAAKPPPSTSGDAPRVKTPPLPNKGTPPSGSRDGKAKTPPSGAKGPSPASSDAKKAPTQVAQLTGKATPSPSPGTSRAPTPPPSAAPAKAGAAAASRGPPVAPKGAPPGSAPKHVAVRRVPGQEAANKAQPAGSSLGGGVRQAGPPPAKGSPGAPAGAAEPRPSSVPAAAPPVMTPATQSGPAGAGAGPGPTAAAVARTAPAAAGAGAAPRPAVGGLKVKLPVVRAAPAPPAAAPAAAAPPAPAQAPTAPGAAPKEARASDEGAQGVTSAGPLKLKLPKAILKGFNKPNPS